nr:MAG TPA: xylanase inhibitor [Caudoviricetes sp.]
MITPPPLRLHYRGVLIDTGSLVQTSREFLPEKFLRFER